MQARFSRCCSTLIVSLIVLCASAVPARAQNFAMATASGGMTIGGSGDTWTGGFGNVNGLGIGTPGTGVTVITSGVSNGALYTSPVDMSISGAGASNKAVVKAHVSSNFSHPSVLELRVCYPASGCASAANYTAISLNSGTPTDVIPSPGVLNGTYTAWFAVFVSNLNGASAFTGTDPATITLRTYAYPAVTLKDTDTFALTNPTTNVQTALRFNLATAGGLTITPASDFSTAYGNVNGLGIGPGTGLTVTTSAGGALYSTPYSIEPRFSSFLSTTGSVKVYVSTDFAHPTTLEFRDSPDNSTFTAISKDSGSPTTITSTITSGTNLTRYLGLSVAIVNGGSAFTGADSAALRYTLVVP